MVTVAKKITKRQRYINGLEHDVEHFKKDLERMIQQKQFTTWYHGELKTRTWIRGSLEECREELEKIKNDPNYKPWEGMDI